ncbi:MAG TPA: anti-sigma factor [Bacillales bacterium]|nr:anti-sigma factor [Bacillales bacterium]
MADHVSGLLSAYLDQELDDKEKERVEQHLENCPACHEELESLAALKKQIAFAYETVEAPDGLEMAVMDKIEERRHTVQTAAAVRKWGMAVMAVFLVAILVNEAAPAFSLGAAMVTFMVRTSFRLLQVLPFFVTSVPYLQGIVFAAAIGMIIFSLWSLRRLLGAGTFS